MRPTLIVLTLLFAATPALSFDISNGPFERIPLPAKPAPTEIYTGGGRQGGDTVADAVVVLGLPFLDSGSTCGYANDYDAACPFTDSTAPDLVYVYSVVEDEGVAIDLCSSQYDTKVYVWEDTPGAVLACNDDAGCGVTGWQSRIEYLNLTGGHTYYVVVDGYGAECGAYELSITSVPPCVLVIPPNSRLEGEPPCSDDYFDVYNGGCNGAGWMEIPSCVLCGKSGTYLSGGDFYRDTDWFDILGAGEVVSVYCTAEFPVFIAFFHQTQCYASFDYAVADRCEEASLSRVVAAGQHAWIVVAPSVFADIPCESDYELRVCGSDSWYVPLGTCCLPDGSCTYTSGVHCVDWLHGDWLGPCVSCAPSPCTPSGNDDALPGPATPRIRAVPNPGAHGLLFQYDLSKAGDVTLEIFDASGSLVRQFSQTLQPAGQHSIEWDGRDNAGTSLPAGVYLVRHQTIDGTTSGKVALAR